MVEYDAKTTVSTNGTTVVIAGSKAKEMVNNGNTDGKVIDKDGKSCSSLRSTSTT